MDINDENVLALTRGICKLETPEECLAFFEDICTVTEIIEMSKRLLAARLLKDNMTYNEVCAATGLSTATISRVNRCLKYGAGGYKTVLSRLDEDK